MKLYYTRPDYTTNNSYPRFHVIMCVDGECYAETHCLHTFRYGNGSELTHIFPYEDISTVNDYEGVFGWMLYASPENASYKQDDELTEQYLKYGEEFFAESDEDHRFPESELFTRYPGAILFDEFTSMVITLPLICRPRKIYYTQPHDDVITAIIDIAGRCKEVDKYNLYDLEEEGIPAKVLHDIFSDNYFNDNFYVDNYLDSLDDGTTEYAYPEELLFVRHPDAKLFDPTKNYTYINILTED